MLSASLQSTWDTPLNKSGRQRPKYGANSSYDQQSEVGDGAVMINKKNSFKGSQYNQSNNEASSNYAELPNLRVPQMGKNRGIPLGVTSGSAAVTSPRMNQNNNFGFTAGKSDVLMGNIGKKYRSSSRQSGQKANRRHLKHHGLENGYGSNSINGPGYINDALGSSGLHSNALKNAGGFATGQMDHFNSNSRNSNGHGAGHLLPQISAPSQSQQHSQSRPHSKRSAYIINGDNNGNISSPRTAMNSLSSYNSPSPMMREFSTGVVLTNTEEHESSACTSMRGLKPGNPNWTNQDNFFISESFNGRDIRIYCVLDGHGEHGHLVSRRCREQFPHFIKATSMDFEKAFQMMQNDLIASNEFDVRCSGATCVLACHFGGKLMVYNCGDSRCVLGRRNANGSVYALAMSKDHKPDKPDERKRILSVGGHLGSRQVLVNQPGRGPVSMPVGPCRVWYQHRGETLGLAMSRSLGDSIVHKSGVSAEPELIERQLDDCDDFYILATDGVWDVVDNNHAVQIVQNIASRTVNWNPLEASASICKFARSRWEKLSPMIDDITCIVVKIHR